MQNSLRFVLASSIILQLWAPSIPPPIPRLHFGTAGNLAAILRDIQFNYIVGGIFLIMTSTGGCDTAFDPAPNHLVGVRVYSGPRERVLGF